MGHWVTLDDDQHVYISDGGKVLATRGKISSAGGGKERGKALAARSKAAIGRVGGKVKETQAYRKSAEKSHALDKAKEEYRQYNERTGNRWKDKTHERLRARVDK